MKLKLSSYKPKTLVSPYIFPNSKELNPKFRPRFLAVDTECTGLRWYKDHKPFAISLGWIENDTIRTAFYAWGVNCFTREPEYSTRIGMNCFNSWYYDDKIPKVFANAKYDMHMIAKHLAFWPRGPIYDVLIAAWCCNTLEKSYGLNDLCEKYVEINQNDEEVLAKETKSARLKASKDNWNCGSDNTDNYRQDYWILRELDWSNKTLETYARKDAERTVSLWNYFEEGMKVLDTRSSFEIEMKVAKVIYSMEERGIKFFKEKCEEQKEKCEFEKLLHLQSIRNHFNDPNLNLNSPKQLQKVLYGNSPNSLKLPVTKKTKSGQPSTDTPTLLQYENISVIKDLLTYRGYDKGIGTCKNYLERCIKDGNISYDNMFDQDHCWAMHPTFNQVSVEFDKGRKTSTGRLSASNPNLQNVGDPAKSGGYFVIDARSFFGPRDGYIWLLIDYSQLELRIFAERCGGKLKEAFLTGRDPHNETRVNVPFLAAMEEKKGRKIAKNTNFTVVNAGGPGVLNEKYSIPMGEARQIHEELNIAYPEIKRRQYEAMNSAIKYGYIKTLTGRKINVDLSQDQNGRYKYAYRATSYDIQGSAADFIKLAMIAGFNYCKRLKEEKKLDAHLVLSVHDELIFEIKEKHFQPAIARNLIRKMIGVAKPFMDIPLLCDAEITRKTWSSEDKEELCL